MSDSDDSFGESFKKSSFSPTKRREQLVDTSKYILENSERNRKLERKQEAKQEAIDEVLIDELADIGEMRTRGREPREERETAKIKLKETQGAYRVMGLKLEEGSSVILIDVDSKRFLIDSGELDLDVQIDGRDLVKSSQKIRFGEKEYSGYILYKEYSGTIKFLDEFFVTSTKTWRDCLKRELPVAKVRNEGTEFLWEGTYKGEQCKLFEYTKVCLAFITSGTFPEIGERKMNCKIGNITHSAYYIPKVKADSVLSGIVREDYGSKYKLSEPRTSVLKSNGSDPVLIMKREIVVKSQDEDGKIEEEDVTVELYNYTDSVFAYTISPDFDIGFSEIRGKRINGNQLYMFRKNDEQAARKFKKFTKIDISLIPRSEHVEELSQSIPKTTKKAGLEMEFFTMISNISKETFSNVKQEEFGKKYTVIGPSQFLENFQTDDRLIFQGTFYGANGDEVLFMLYEKEV